MDCRIKRIFPTEMLPAENAKTEYALVHFGGNANDGEIDPNQTGFGFILITGDSAAVSSLKKRDDEPAPRPPYNPQSPAQQSEGPHV